MTVRSIMRLAGGALLAYLCWRILNPFLPALCWAFALAMVADPFYQLLLRKKAHPGLAAATTVILAAAVVLVPVVLLGGALAREAADLAGRFKGEDGWFVPAIGWLDARFDVAREAMQLARSAAGWASSAISSILKGSAWLLTQAAVTLFVCFYFLRDGGSLVKRFRKVIPLTDASIDVLFTRITQTIRVALGGKVILAGLQGTLGGLMFYWLGLPAPVFWGAVMAVLSVFPVVGSFVVWLPAAILMALQGDWKHALLLTGWGVVIIHPVDNVLGPILVGKTLRVHTLLMFFSILGGLAAFGATGLVLGPLTMAIVTGLFDLADRPGKRAAASLAAPAMVRRREA